MQLAVLAFVSILSLFGTASHTFAARAASAEDRAVIQRRRIVLVRGGQLEKQFPHKKRAVVTYPVVSGLSDPAVLRRVRSLLDFKNIFDSSLKDYREDTWLDEFSYVVNHNGNSLLDITFKQSGSGAYPDEHQKHFLIDLRKGSLVKASDVFVADLLERLVSLVDAQLQIELKDIARENAKTTSDYKEFVESQGEQRFGLEDLKDFSVGARGVTFLFDAGFPHAIKAFEPRGGYFFRYSKLKPYIKRDGPLGQFVR